MSQTSQRSIKDSLLSIVQVNDIADMVAGSVYSVGIRSAADQQWWLDVSKSTINDIEYLGLHIRIGDTHYDKYSTAVAISLKNDNLQDTKIQKLTVDYSMNDSWGFEQFIEMSQVIEENNGFSRNGAFTLRVEIGADVITDKKGIRRFNLHDPFEGCVKFESERGRKTFYAMKEMVMFYSPVLAKIIEAGEEEFFFSNGNDDFEYEFEMFLQLIHGVSIEIVPKDCFDAIFAYAVEYGTNDIIRRCETYLSINFVRGWVRGPMVSKINHVKRKLKTKKSLEEVRKMAKRSIECPLDSEMLKAFVREFFSYADNSWSLNSVEYRED